MEKNSGTRQNWPRLDRFGVRCLAQPSPLPSHRNGSSCQIVLFAHIFVGFFVSPSFLLLFPGLCDKPQPTIKNQSEELWMFLFSSSSSFFFLASRKYKKEKEGEYNKNDCRTSHSQRSRECEELIHTRACTARARATIEMGQNGE